MKLIIAALCVCAMSGCRAAPKNVAAPARADGAVRLVSYNIYKCQRGEDAIVAQINSLSRDVTCLQELRVEDHEKLAERLGMHHVFQNHRNYPNEGVAIYSRTRQTNVQPVIDADGRTCALFADTVIAGRKITFVSVHLVATQHLRQLLRSNRMRGTEIELIKKAWRDRGGGAIIIAGDFNQIPMGANYAAMTKTFTDALASIKQTAATLEDGVLRARVDYFLHDRNGWKTTAGGIGAAGASDHRLIWIDGRFIQ